MVMQQDFSDIGIHHFPERYYLIRQIDGTSEKDYMEKTNRLILDFKHAEQRNDYEVAYLQYGKNLSRQIYNAYDNVYFFFWSRNRSIWNTVSCRRGII
ncbi:MAG: hypothetical protein ACLUD2_13920 [Clostridium sp.]